MKVPVDCLPFVILLAIVSLRSSAVPIASGTQGPLDSSEEDYPEDVGEYFASLDTNNDGVLSLEEYSAPLEEGVTQSEEYLLILEKWFREYNVNTDGKISSKSLSRGNKTTLMTMSNIPDRRSQ